MATAASASRIVSAPAWRSRPASNAAWITLGRDPRLTVSTYLPGLSAMAECKAASATYPRAMAAVARLVSKGSIVVNIPEFPLRADDKDFKIGVTMEVVVGRTYGHDTPMFSDTVEMRRLPALIGRCHTPLPELR